MRRGQQRWLAGQESCLGRKEEVQDERSEVGVAQGARERRKRRGGRKHPIISSKFSSEKDFWESFFLHFCQIEVQHLMRWGIIFIYISTAFGQEDVYTHYMEHQNAQLPLQPRCVTLVVVVQPAKPLQPIVCRNEKEKL